MTKDPMKNVSICSGLFAFIVSMAALGVVNLCCDFFAVYLSIPLCVLISLLITAAVICITWLCLRVHQLEVQAAYLRSQLQALEKKFPTAP